MPGPIAAASRPPPSAAAALSTIPPRRPRQPTCSAAIAGCPPFARASATGRQSAVKTSNGSPGVSDQTPSPGFPCPSARRTSGPCTWRPKRRSSRSVPASAQRRLRFSVTCSGSSSVRRPRLSVSNGASLIPPTRVENAAAYGPGVSHRISARSATDQLARGGQFRLAAVEVAAELAAAELVEHLPHLRRLRETELREVGAVDVEVDIPQAK